MFQDMLNASPFPLFVLYFNLSCFHNAAVIVTSCIGEDFGVLLLAVMFIVTPCSATTDFSEADILVVPFLPRLSGQIGLPTIDLTTLKRNTVHMHSLHFRVSQKLETFFGVEPCSVIQRSYEIYTQGNSSYALCTFVQLSLEL